MFLYCSWCRCFEFASVKRINWDENVNSTIVIHFELLIFDCSFLLNGFASGSVECYPWQKNKNSAKNRFAFFLTSLLIATQKSSFSKSSSCFYSIFKGNVFFERILILAAGTSLIFKLLHERLLILWTLNC